MGIDIWPGILDFARLAQHLRCHFVEIGDQLEHGIIGEMLKGKGTLTGVTGIRLAQNRMAESRHHFTRFQRIPYKRRQLLFRRVLPQLHKSEYV